MNSSEASSSSFLERLRCHKNNNTEAIKSPAPATDPITAPTMPPVDKDFLLPPLPAAADEEEADDEVAEAETSAVLVTLITVDCDPSLGEAVMVEIRVVTALALEEVESDVEGLESVEEEGSSVDDEVTGADDEVGVDDDEDEVEVVEEVVCWVEDEEVEVEVLEVDVEEEVEVEEEEETFSLVASLFT